ncbi:MAG: arylsulfatase, partial [Gemmatimonadota bacterium]
TLAELAGLRLLPGPVLDGLSLAPVLRGEGTVPEDRTLCVNYSRMPGGTDYPTPDAASVMRIEGAAVLWKRWRLIEGTALYDLDTDPGQARDVAAEHPDVVRLLRARLEAWWRDVEPVANQVQRVVIGSDAENPMTLSACEWRDVFVDQQRQVRVAERKNGYWHLQVARAGTYTFELRRWPRESGLTLRQACPAARLFDGDLAEGVALPIARARILVARQRQAVDLTPADDAATFNVHLDAGPTLLHTWFDDDRGQPLCGAYYVGVERQGP